MKQTAVEWLIDKIVQDQMYKAKSQKEWIDIFEQAKAMEKEQIKHTYLTCWKDYTGWDGKHWEMGRDPNITFNEYYNETFIQEDTEDTWDGKWESGEIDPSGCSGPYANI